MRFEYKYLVPPDLMPALRRMMIPFLRFDAYAQPGEVRDYSVRSIYYDTAGLKYYREKLSGLKNRKKLRLRGYGEAATEETRVFLEIKRKHENTVSKDRAPVLFRDIGEMLRTGAAERFVKGSEAFPNADGDGRRFLYHLFRETLRPVVLIVYEREAYFGKFDRTLRVTVDKNLRSALFPAPERLFFEESILSANLNSYILEVKYHEWFPSWLADILRSLRLQRQSFSKYCSCVDDHLTENRLILSDIHLLPTHAYLGRGRLS
jgi:hypothetical protein